MLDDVGSSQNKRCSRLRWINLSRETSGLEVDGGRKGVGNAGFVSPMKPVPNLLLPSLFLSLSLSASKHAPTGASPVTPENTPRQARQVWRSVTAAVVGASPLHMHTALLFPRRRILGRPTLLSALSALLRLNAAFQAGLREGERALADWAVV